MEEATLHRLQPRTAAARAEARRDLPDRRARSSPTTRSSCSTRRGSRRRSSAGLAGVRDVPGEADRRRESRRGTASAPATRQRARRAGRRGARRRSRPSPSACSSCPTPRVLARIKEHWHADRKPANVMLVVDVSRSMGEQDKIAQAPSGLQVFLAPARPAGPRRAASTFSDDVHDAVPIAPVRDERAARCARRRRDLSADGATALTTPRATASASVRAPRRRQPHQRGRGAQRRPGHHSRSGARAVLAQLSAARASETRPSASSRSPTAPTRTRRR